MTEVEVEVTRTRRDIINGIWANAMHSPARLAWYGAGALLVAVIAIFANNTRPTGEQMLIGAVGFMAMLALYALILAFSVWMAARRTWGLPGALDPVKYRFSNEGIGVESGNGRGVSHWAVWHSAFETRSLLVIRSQLNLIHILPKRDLNGNALHAVRAILRAHLKRVRVMENAA